MNKDLSEFTENENTQDNWQSTKLRNLLEKDESGVWGDDPEGVEGVPVLRATNFASDHIDLEDVAYRDIPESKKQNKQLQYGDIILERSGGSADQPVGRVLFFDLKGEYYPGNFLRLLRPDENKVYSHYLYYQLEYIYRRGGTVPIQSNTTNIRNLQFNSYMNQTIPLPPLDKQKEIAEALRDIEKNILQLKDLIEQYETVEFGVMQQLLREKPDEI
ncbi:restriction endonuclease subunit S [Halorubrum sp. AJ67]|uniref:restriction endonuclease subunit S n=1 Tax=Halorubrum sp. AJ67 TaxID=1173487 RepID=UPI0003DD74D3|nr:restriction endonuclease subunit S [Halorubrum sp. AJ67]CDK39489.1 putative type I restriction enzyme specificity protein [Halorubrum sp. AJ67]